MAILNRGGEKSIMIGKTISHYKILEKLGEGGMGVVYKAEDTKLDRVVALKFLPHHLTASETDKARFLQEARAASAINHPNVCIIYDIQEHEGQHFIVMEYIEGKTLRGIISENLHEVLNLREVFDYAIQITDGLKAAHDKGVIHRDVKSENIMVTPTGQIKVTDFGLAKLKGALRLTKTASTLGTIAYMAPEQVQGAEVDDRSDIFSFGVVLYEMLTGQLPFRGEYESAIMYAILNEQPEPVQEYRPDISFDFLRVLNRALEKRPDDRYQTMNDLLIDLKRVNRESDQWAQPPSATVSDKDKDRILTRPTKRQSLRLAIPLLSIALMTLLLVIYFAVIKPSGQATERITLVVADINNETDEKELDALSEPLITSLEISRRLAVMTRSRIYDIARQMGRQNIQSIDEVFCRDVCKHANVKILVMPSIRKIGNRYSLDLKIEDIEKNEYLYTDSERFEKPETVFDKIDELAARTRKNLKETNREIQVSKQKVADVITANLTALQHYFKGEDLCNKLKFEEALEEYQKAIALDSTFGLAYYRIGALFSVMFRGSNEQSAIAPLQRAIALMDRIPEKEGYLVRANKVAWELWPTVGLEILKEMERIYPNEKQMLFLIGSWSRRFAGQNQIAAEYLERVLEMDPLFGPGVRELAITYRTMKRYDDALEVVNRYSTVNQIEGAILIAQHFYQLRDYAKAEKYFQEVLEMDPKSAAALGGLMWTYKKMELDDEMLHFAKRYAYVANTENQYRGIATNFATAGDFDDGLKALRGALQEANESSFDRAAVIRVGIANLFMYNDQYEEAETVLLPLIKTSQSNQIKRWGYEWLYKVNLYNGRYKEALQFCDKLINIHRQANLIIRFSRIQVRKGLIRMWGWNDVENALQEEKKAAAYQNTIRWPSYRAALFNLNMLIGNYENAKNLIDGSLDRILVLHSVKGECIIADSLANTIRSRTSSSIVWLYHLAQCHAEKGQLEKGLKFLTELQLVYENSMGYRAAYYPKSVYLMGKIYEQMGERELAIQNYEKLLALWKNADEDLVDLIDAKARLAKLKQSF